VVGAELELELVASRGGTTLVREPGIELAIPVAEEPVVIEEALVLDSVPPVAVARTELAVVLTSTGLSCTSGSAATKTKATSWAPNMLPPEVFEGAACEESTARTEELLIGARSVLGVEVVLLLSISVILAREAL
jgi:hypothetical protein